MYLPLDLIKYRFLLHLHNHATIVILHSPQYAIITLALLFCPLHPHNHKVALYLHCKLHIVHFTIYIIAVAIIDM